MTNRATTEGIAQESDVSRNNRDELEALAVRVESATGPDRELNRSIAHRRGWSHFFVQKDMWWRSPTGITHGDAPNYTGSLDAAMSLVPEGWWIASLGQARSGRVTTVILYNDDVLPHADCPAAATPALALTAAALRSHARGEK